MNEIIKQLGTQAGFYVALDGNFYGKDAWCNEEVAQLCKLVAEDCIKQLALQALQHADNDDQVWLASQTINLLHERYGLK